MAKFRREGGDQTVTFLSDGGDTVRELPRGLIPQAEYLLDWFHVTMRLTGMSRMAQGVRAEAYPELGADPAEMLEHLKWNLWHGKVDRALEITDELTYALDVENGSPEHRKLLGSGARLRDLPHQQPRLCPELRRAVAAGKNHFHGLCGVGRQPGGEQTIR